MRLLLFSLFLLLPTLTLGQSACYLFVGGEFGGNSSKIDSIIRPLLATFVAPLKQLPAAGIPESKLASSCFYEVSLLSSENGLDLSITGQCTPVSLNGASQERHPSSPSGCCCPVPLWWITSHRSAEIARNIRV